VVRALRHKAGIAERLFGRFALYRRGRKIFLDVTGDPEKLLNLSVRFSALCILISLLLSRNLWFQDKRAMLPTPLFDWAAALPDINGLLYAVLFGINALLLVAPKYRRAGFATIPVYVYLVLQDEIRWQFYLYMQFFNLLAAALPPRKVKDTHLDPLRFMLIGVYFWAGLFKINPHFVNDLFPWFVSPWFPFTRAAQVIGIFVPFIELGIGICLLLPKARPLGQLFATSMLIVVMLSLGPTGMNGAQFVWPANFYMDFLAILLFMDTKRALVTPARLKKPAALAAILLFILLPALGMGNLLGHHQTFKLFCCRFHTQLSGMKGGLDDFLPPDMESLNVSGYPVFPSSRPYVPGISGLCRYLPNPEKITLEVLQDPVPFWSGEVELLKYKGICTGDPQLISAQKVYAVHLPSR
jgi:hypothetical protein